MARCAGLIDLSDVYMTFFVPETVAGQLALGSGCVSCSMPCPVRDSGTTVVCIEHSAIHAKTVETANERQKLMFRVKAQIAPELLQKHQALVRKTGLPGVAWLKPDAAQAWPAPSGRQAAKGKAWHLPALPAWCNWPGWACVMAAPKPCMASLDIPARCMVGLIGPDGVGESSLLSLLAGARACNRGQVQVLGGDMRNKSAPPTPFARKLPICPKAQAKRIPRCR